MTNLVIDRKKYGELNWEIEDKKAYREFSTSDEAIEWGNAYYKDWSTSYQKVFSLTKGFVKGSLACTPIESYCGYAFEKINQFLRFDIDNEFNTYRELADILAIALCSAPRIPFKLVVYRLVCDAFIEDLISQNRDLSLPTQEKGFMSTSLLPDIVNSKEKYASKRNLLKIYVDEESIGIYVNPVALRSEQEILFPPNGHLALIQYPYYDTSCGKTIYECKLMNFYN
ncbi:MAG: ADP-ribosyltransferase [Oscillospiraceae bacterium]|nr:ADP-ribosyltransferase [Oscillospiraceae bacterium]